MDAVDGKLRELRREFAGGNRNCQRRVRKRNGRREGRDKTVVQRVMPLMRAAHRRRRVLGHAAHRLSLGNLMHANRRATAFRWIAKHSAGQQRYRSRHKCEDDENGLNTAHRAHAITAGYRAFDISRTFQRGVAALRPVQLRDSLEKLCCHLN